jgi:hypothetical protein
MRFEASNYLTISRFAASSWRSIGSFGPWPCKEPCQMLKHRGFPGRMPGTDFQFTIRRANVKEGATKLVRRERFKDRKHADRLADQTFMAALWQHFGEEPFERGNLDAGRLSWLLGREVVPAEDPFDPASYEALLRIDVKRAEASFPEVFAPGAQQIIGDDEDEDWA